MVGRHWADAGLRPILIVRVLSSTFRSWFSSSVKSPGTPSAFEMVTHASLVLLILTHTTPVSLVRACTTPRVLPQPLGPSTTRYALLGFLVLILTDSANSGRGTKTCAFPT